MSELVIKYLADSVEGPSLGTIVRGSSTGWVEYCNRAGQLYYSDSISDEFFQELKREVIVDIANWFKTEQKKQLGFVHHLSTVLVTDSFLFPMFGTMIADNDYPEITVGRSRLVASIVNGCTASDLKTIIFALEGRTIKNLKNVKELISTSDFEKIYNLKDIDYEIAMSDNVHGTMDDLKFKHSILKYSIYDKNDQALPHLAVGSSLLSFWDQHIKQEKILINIRCTPEVEKLIQPSDIFKYNIVHEKSGEWEWSYGKILGSYRKSEESRYYETSLLNLWLYDVTEPVNLELMIPWMNGQYTCCHTQNKKALIFDTSRDATSMQCIGNWAN
jgi:hypothetical protein